MIANRRTITPGFANQNLGSDYTAEEVDFLRAISDYKQANQRPFPTWKEVLAITHALGYRRVAVPVPLPRVREVLGVKPSGGNGG